MTTKTPIAEPANQQAAPSLPPGLPDIGDLMRLANGFFNATPGLDGLGRGPSVYAADSSISAARQAATAGPTTSTPISFSGAGFSPTGIDPQGLGLLDVPAAERFAFGQPGSAVPPLGVSLVGPGNLATAPEITDPGFDLSGIGLPFADQTQIPAIPTTTRHHDASTSQLYIVSDALARTVRFFWRRYVAGAPAPSS